MGRWLLIGVVLLGGLIACGAALAQEEEEEDDESSIPPWERVGDDDDSAGEGEDEDEVDHEDEVEVDHEGEDEVDHEDEVDREHEVDHEDEDEAQYDDEDEDDDDDEYEDEDDYAPRSDSRDAALGPVERYERDRLKLWRYRTAEEYPNALAALFRPRVRWGVRSAGGTSFSALAMARLMGDTETANKVAGQQAGWISLGSGLTAVGLGILIGGTATYGVANTREDEGRGTSRRSGLQGAQGALTAGLLVGPILIGAGTSVLIGGVRRTRQVARYYDREDAEDAIEDYNHRLMRTLDLDWEDVQGRDLRRVPVQLRLAVGPASFGLSVTF